MANASSAYVVPAGRYLFAGLTGEDPSGTNEWRGALDMFNTGDGRGALGSATDAWNAQRLGYGVLDSPEALQAGLIDARGRYLGGPNQAGWSDRWNQWNATDVTGPDGNTLLSPVHQTGLRVGQDYGVRRDAQGNVAGPIGGDIFQGYSYLRNKLAENPYLDPTNQLGGYRGMMASSPYEKPGAQHYAAAMQRAQGGPDMADAYGQRGLTQNQGLASSTDFDQYGLRGIQQTNDINSANLAKLTRGIDREAQESLANRLPEISQAFEAAGLGRSGASQLQMLQAQGDILSQANRDKQRTLADFQEANAGRQANAINLATQQGYGGEGQKFGALSQAMNLGSQIGAQGYEGYAGRQGQAALAGLQDSFTMNEANRAGERSLWQQAMDRQFQQYGQDTQGFLNALQAGGQYQLGTLDAERMGQSSALQDWLGLQANRNQTQSDSLNQYLTLANAQRGIDQDRLNQMLSAGMMPVDMLMRIATGTSAPAGAQGGGTSFWGNALGGVGAGVGQGIGQWLSGAAGGQQQSGYANEYPF